MTPHEVYEATARDFHSELTQWDRPASMALERMIDVTCRAFESDWIREAFGHGWDPLDLFGYLEHAETQQADFGIVTGLGMNQFAALLLLEPHIAV